MNTKGKVAKSKHLDNKLISSESTREYLNLTEEKKGTILALLYFKREIYEQRKFIEENIRATITHTKNSSLGMNPFEYKKPGHTPVRKNTRIYPLN